MEKNDIEFYLMKLNKPKICEKGHISFPQSLWL